MDELERQLRDDVLRKERIIKSYEEDLDKALKLLRIYLELKNAK